MSHSTVMESGTGAGHDHALAQTEDASHRLGTFAGWTVSACAVHCVLVAVASLLPLAGLGVLGSAWFDWTMVGLAALVGGVGLGVSLVRVHGDPKPALVFGIGLAVLAIAHSAFEGSRSAHAIVSVAGAAVILLAGRMNHLLVHRCQACHPHPHPQG